MLAIYTERNWIEAIGYAADHILFHDPAKDSEYIVLMASEKNFAIQYPFLQADVCRRPETSSNRGAFIPTKIPVDRIAAVFDFTEDDSKKIGFAPKHG